MVAQTGTEINHVERIYRRHADALRRFHPEERGIALISLLLALRELAETLQHDDYALDEQLAAVEHVLEAHDPALFADVASGCTGLATAIDALISANYTALAALTGDMMQANADLIRLRAELDAEEAETDALRSQLAQMDADNARLTAELATLRSYVTAPADSIEMQP